MSQIEYITVKNASRKVLNHMRQIGIGFRSVGKMASTKTLR